MVVWKYGCMYVWMNEWNEWMNEWMYVCMFVCVYLNDYKHTYVFDTYIIAWYRMCICRTYKTNLIVIIVLVQYNNASK